MKRINWKIIREKIDDFAVDAEVFCWYVPDVQERADSMFRREDCYLASPPGDQYAIIVEEVEKQGIQVDWEKVWVWYGYWLYTRDNTIPVDVLKKIQGYVNKFRLDR